MTFKVSEISVPISGATQNMEVVVKVTGVRRFKWRLFFVLLLLRFCRFISPVEMDIQYGIKEKEDHAGSITEEG